MYFLYHKVSSKTGKKLGTALGIRRGQGRTAEQRPPLIRWGNAAEFNAPTILNQRNAILNASDKLQALTILAEAGVRVPEFQRHAPFDDGTWFGRSRHGYGGRDIAVYSGHAAYGHHDFFSRYVPNKREYRIHVFKGEIIRLQGKWLDFPDQQTSPYIQNAANGFRFRTPNFALRPERTEMAIKAVEALGLDFGAVDLLVGEDGLTYVLEVNTAPGCSPMTARAYVEAIRHYVQTEGYNMPAITYEVLEELSDGYENTGSTVGGSSLRAGYSRQTQASA
jgi:predicted ATP-grasp superfamily ATP-dependent carboligase